MRIEFKYPELLLVWLTQFQKLIYADNIDSQVQSDFDALYSIIQGGRMIEEGTSFSIEFLRGCDSTFTQEFVFQSEGLYVSRLHTYDDYCHDVDDTFNWFQYSTFRIRWGEASGIKAGGWGSGWESSGSKETGSKKATVISLNDILAEFNQKALTTSSLRDVRRMVDYEIAYSKSDLISIIKKFNGFYGALMGTWDKGWIDLAVSTRNGMLALRFHRSYESNTVNVSVRKGIGEPQTYACVWDALDAIPVVWYRSGVRVYRAAATELQDWQFAL